MNELKQMKRGAEMVIMDLKKKLQDATISKKDKDDDLYTVRSTHTILTYLALLRQISKS
jgi:hypothetical protein